MVPPRKRAVPQTKVPRKKQRAKKKPTAAARRKTLQKKVDAFRAKDQYAQAIDLLLPLAEKGDVFAMDLLAQQYEYASDDVRDLKQALHWHLRAASALW